MRHRPVPPQRRRRSRGVAAGTGAVVALVLAAGCDATPTAGATAGTVTANARDVAATVGTDTCGTGWTGGTAGAWTFHMTNTSVGGMDVAVADAADDMTTAREYVELEALGAGATADATVTLAAGRYRVVCLPADADPVLGPVVTVTGTLDGTATPGVVPLTYADLVPATRTYEQWVSKHLETLARQVRTLDDDVRDGDRAAARRDWLTAHTTYGTLGGAYGAFGDLGDAIDGLPPTGTTALADTDLTGFRRAEALLWSGRPVADARPVTRRLVRNVADLRKQFASAQLDPTDLGIRAHEILEDALQVQLRGVADGASGTTLAEVAAAVVGARQPLGALRPLLTARGVDLAPDDDALDAVAQTVRTFRHDGRWTPLDHLTTAQRERLDAAVDAAVETLADVAALTDPRRAL